MIIYTTGDLLKSDAEALVNTVNCEGYMGKGIAYQFKLAYPQNNESYIEACKNRKLRIGKIHYYKECGKIIINFPTKDRWRAKSKMEYIESGLDELILVIKHLNIKTIAIPPLGSGNGGLSWGEVRKVIEKKLFYISNKVKIIIYEPTQNYIVTEKIEPKLRVSGLVLMDIKNKLHRFDTLRLQSTVYFMNIFSGKDYFKFRIQKKVPHNNTIDAIAANIKKYQEYYGIKNTKEAYAILYRKIISEKNQKKLDDLNPFIKKATEFVNSISNNEELRWLICTLYLIEERGIASEEEIIVEFKKCYKDENTEIKVEQVIRRLYTIGVLERTLTGYTILR